MSQVAKRPLPQARSIILGFKILDLRIKFMYGAHLNQPGLEPERVREKSVAM